jgi:ABC-2 type transport system permease protein
MMIAAISIVSGLYFPVDLLPVWIRWLSDVQPFTPTVDLMRHVLVGLPLTGTLAADLIKLFLFAFVMLPITIYILSAAGRYSRRRGTVIEY